MARTSRKSVRKNKRAPRQSQSARAKASRLRLSNDEYVSIVALIALFLIAAIVLKGPAILRGESPIAGQAFVPPPQSVASGIDHEPPAYEPPADWSPDASSDDGDASPATSP